MFNWVKNPFSLIDLLRGFQLETTKSILVFSHDHNSFDKKELLQNPNNFINLSEKTIDDFIKEPDLKKFFMEDIDILIKDYEPGRIENKPDVINQIAELRLKREKMIQEQMKKQEEMNLINNNLINNNIFMNYQNKMNEMNVLLQELLMENNLLKEKVVYLENKITNIVQTQIQKKQG